MPANKYQRVPSSPRDDDDDNDDKDTCNDLAYRLTFLLISLSNHGAHLIVSVYLI